MTEKQLITPVTTTDHATEEGLFIERTQDVEPLLELNKARKSQFWDGYNEDRSMQLVFELPAVIYEQWLKEGVDMFNPDHAEECERRMRDPNLAGFRVDTPVQRNIIVKGRR